MARIRTIKPDFWTDEKIVELSAFARLLFIGLWNFADDEGRMECSPKRIKMQILPADSAEVPRLLDELERMALIKRYVVDGIEYLQICGFAKHQKVDKRSPSKHPAPPKQSNNPRRIPPNPADGREGNGSGSKTPEVISAVVTETTAPPPPAAEITPAEAGTAKPIAQALSLDALRVTPAVGTDQHEASGAIWAVLAANGCRGTASHPAVIEMARAGVTVDEVRKAIAKARQSKDGALSPPYIAAIVEDMRANPAKANGKSAAWATDERATEAKARELGLWPAKANESWDALRGRIRAKLEMTAQELVR